MTRSTSLPVTDILRLVFITFILYSKLLHIKVVWVFLDFEKKMKN